MGGMPFFLFFLLIFGEQVFGSFDSGCITQFF